MKGNKITIKSIPKSCKWCDKDIIMLHVCFQILEAFVEEEMLTDTTEVDYEWNKPQRDFKKEALELYNWWQKRKHMDDPVDDTEQEIDQEMLERLIKIRTSLWT